jgi:hypothetical protein
MQRIWWFHVKLTVKNLPMESWNEDTINQILRDEAVADSFMRHSIRSAKDASRRG